MPDPRVQHERWERPMLRRLTGATASATGPASAPTEGYAEVGTFVFCFGPIS